MSLDLTEQKVSVAPGVEQPQVLDEAIVPVALTTTDSRIVVAATDQSFGVNTEDADEIHLGIESPVVALELEQVTNQITILDTDQTIGLVVVDESFTLGVHEGERGPVGPVGPIGPPGDQRIYIQDDPPADPPETYLWIETGLGSDGAGFTFWVEAPVIAPPPPPDPDPEPPPPPPPPPPPLSQFTIWGGVVPPDPNIERAYDGPLTAATVIDLGEAATAKALLYYLHSNLTAPQNQQRPVKMAIFADGNPTPLVVVDTTPIPESEITMTEGRWVRVDIPPLALTPGRYFTAGQYFVTDGASNWSRYALIRNYFQDPYQPIVSGPITVPHASTIGGNGRFFYGTSLQYPTDTFNGHGYFIDIEVEL